MYCICIITLERIGTESCIVFYAMKERCWTVSVIFLVASFILRNIKLYISIMWSLSGHKLLLSGHDLLSGLQIDRAKAEDKLTFNISHKSREYLNFNISFKNQRIMIATNDTDNS